jgi:hypothetical protein
LILNPLLITDLIFRFLSKFYRLKVGFFFCFVFFLGLKSILYIALFSNFVGFYFLLCRKQTQRWLNPLRKKKKKKKLT